MSSKSSSAHALDQLWSNMKSLVPLISILSSFDNKNGTIISDEELDRFDSYSKRIRVLSTHDYSGKEISLATVLTVAVRLGRMCLLPYLRCLFLGGAHMEEAGLLFLLSPQLSHFKLWIAGNEPVAFAALDALCKTSRLLTALDLTCTITQETFIELCEIPNLECFLLRSRSPQPLIIRNNFFHSLAASSETLYHLALHCSLLFLLVDSPPPLEQLTFSILKKFEIILATDVVCHISRLFSTARFPQLEFLHIDFCAGGHQSLSLSWEAFRTFTTSHLRSLILESHGTECLELQFSTLLNSLWGSLEKLSISGYVLKPIAPTEWSKFLSSQKALKYLCLTDRSSFGIGFNALVGLATNMDHLEHITIALDFETVPPITEVPILNHKLRFVNFFCAPPQDPLTFCWALDRLFPHIEHANPLFASGWHKARLILKTLQEVRQDQIVRA